jgi:hypothetical protein
MTPRIPPRAAQALLARVGAATGWRRLVRSARAAWIAAGIAAAHARRAAAWRRLRAADRDLRRRVRGAS